MFSNKENFSYMKNVITLSANINKADTPKKLLLRSNPYSRNYIVSVCAKNSIECEYQRIDKNYEEFILHVNSKGLSTIKHCLELINLHARQLKDKGHHAKFSQLRNEFVSAFIEILSISDQEYFDKIAGEHKIGRKPKLLKKRLQNE